MKRTLERRISRRALFRAAAVGAAGVGAMAIAGCGEGDDDAAPSATSAAPTSGAGAGRARWSAVARSATQPEARRDHSLTLDPSSGVLYLFGGRTGAASRDDLWVFDPRVRAWTEAAATGARPAPRFGHNASWDRAGKRLILALGQGGAAAFFDDVWAFEPATAAWTRLDGASAERPEVRYGAGGAHDDPGGRILISHGFTDRGRFDDTWTFDVAAGAWRRVPTEGNLPVKRCLTRSLWDGGGGQFLMFGGQTDGTPYLGDFWSLDVAQGAWTEKRPAVLPGPRNLYAAPYDERTRRWYVYGGQTPDGPTGELWVYDVAGDAWSRIVEFEPGAAPAARYGADAAFAAGAIYVFGGNDGKGDLDDLWVLELPPA